MLVIYMPPAGSNVLPFLRTDGTYATLGGKKLLELVYTDFI